MDLKDFKEPSKESMGELFNKGDCFQGQRKGEHIQTILIRHKIVLVPIILISFFGGLSILGINALIREFIVDDADLLNKISLTVDFVFISFLLHFLFINFLNFYLSLVIITNSRIIDIHFTTIFSRNMDTLDLHNIQDITISRSGVWRWMFNFGRIIMHNAAGTELFDFRYLRHPLKNYNIINHVHYKAMHSRAALRKESIKHQTIEPKQTDWDDLNADKST